MADEGYQRTKPEPEPEAEEKDEKPEPEAKADPDPMHFGMSREEIAKVRRDIYRMWHAEPEETR